MYLISVQIIDGAMLFTYNTGRMIIAFLGDDLAVEVTGKLAIDI